MKRQTGYPKRPFKEIFKGPPAVRVNEIHCLPAVSHGGPQALDLLEKMLQFDPERRISIEEALEHPYVASLHVPEDEPSFGSSIDFSFEEKKVDKETMKTLIYQEVCVGRFHLHFQLPYPPFCRCATFTLRRQVNYLQNSVPSLKKRMSICNGSCMNFVTLGL